MWWFPSTNIRQNSSGSVLMNCWRSPLRWSLIFCKTYKFLCNIWCVMCEVWCMMFQTWFFVRSGLYEARGDQKHPLSVTDLFNDIPKLILGGSRMYTISYKASNTTVLLSALVERCFVSRMQDFFYFARLNSMVSHILVELPRTLKGQKWVEFDFQSI